MSYDFHPDAAKEHLDAIGFYAWQQSGLGAVYLTEFEQMMAKVLMMPRRYRVERQPDIRTVSLLKFPYRVIFREVAGEVQILAVSHKKRRPDYWLGRL
jgi:plasmid stabilization system protein ParE